jgi:CubicO group peptidase (beta-lactamase class C family)
MRRLIPRKWLAAAQLALLAFGVGLMQPGWAQAKATPLTAADAEAWLDGMVPSALRAAGVPGAMVVVVKDGQPLVQKGYGFADWEKGTPVDAQRTLFRPGSVSKLFTWTAVMQLVEQGKLDLDADLNRYIDFKIPARNGKALTLRHVLTHTTGLEESARDLITYTSETPDNGKLLKKYIPPYIYDPGTTQGYSNYATSLAGYIVERTSGKSFDEYIEQHIFAPLGMKNSTFRQPLPAALQAQMSRGYNSQDEAAKGFEVVSMAPAGSLSSTGEDMGRFMLAYLGQGRLGDAQLLKPETVKLMHGQITRGLPDLSGIGLGFYQQDVNGHRVVGHGGDTLLFHTLLAVFPDDGIGLYVSVNGGGRHDLGKWLRERMFNAFADRYLPDTRTPVKPSVDEATARAHAKAMAGAYRNSRREDSTFLSLLQLLSPLRVEALDDGRIALSLAGERGVYREVKPWLWEEQHGKRRLQANVEDGKVKRWGLEPYVFAFVFEPVPFMASTTVLVLLLAALAVALLTALLWPVAAILRRKHGAAAPGRSTTLVRIASCVTVLSLVLWTMSVMGMEELKDITVLLALSQLTAFIGFVGGLLVALWHARNVFRSGSRSARVLAVLWVLAFAVLVAVGFYHKMLSFNPNY